MAGRINERRRRIAILIFLPLIRDDGDEDDNEGAIDMAYSELKGGNPKAEFGGISDSKSSFPKRRLYSKNMTTLHIDGCIDAQPYRPWIIP